MPLREAYVLVGPTASGKSDLGQYMAARMGGAIVSADSMLIYQGMNIGTAKPPLSDRGSVPYLGIDLVTPDLDYDVWRYVQAIAHQIAALPADQPILVLGGSGLYIKALVDGLDEKTASPVDRERWNQLYAEQGVAGLQQVLRTRSPASLAALDDPQNPRRLIRAIEKTFVSSSPQDAGQGAGLSPVCNVKPVIPFAGLLTDPANLRMRIAQRVDAMYAAGLLEEAQSLRSTYASLSHTAQQAIGYSEAFAVLDGLMDTEQGKAKTVVRTNRLAKRQRTWFRHQAAVQWVDTGGGEDLGQLADAVENIWRQYGPVQLKLP